MSNSKAVHVLGNPAIQYGRDMVRGICRYMRAFAEWEVFVHPFGMDSLKRIMEMPHDGMLLFSVLESYAEWDEVERMLLGIDVPLVNVSSRELPQPVPSVGTDDLAIGRLGADHLLERGFRHLAFRSTVNPGCVEIRRDGFARRAHESGTTCSVFRPEEPELSVAAVEDADRRTAEWLESLPKPVGVMCWNDELGARLIRAAERRDFRVPEEVAVVGVDNDEMICELARTPLSSVMPGADRVGYEAARILGSAMIGEPVPPRHVLVQPSGVATRRSTDILAIDDPYVAQALRIIRGRACDPIFVGDVVREVPLCRRALERRFLDVMGRSMHREIHRVRFERAKMLLETTNFRIPLVAREVGFKDPKRFSKLFHKNVGLPPSAYRSRARLAAPPHES